MFYARSCMQEARAPNLSARGRNACSLLLSQIRIRVGEYDFSSVLEPYPYAERGAKKKVVHPKYNFFTYENDLALVRVDEPLEFMPHIAPICLPPDNESDDLIGRNATVTGWGRLSEGRITRCAVAHSLTEH